METRTEAALPRLSSDSCIREFDTRIPRERLWGALRAYFSAREEPNLVDTRNSLGLPAGSIRSCCAIWSPAHFLREVAEKRRKRTTPTRTIHMGEHCFFQQNLHRTQDPLSTSLLSSVSNKKETCAKVWAQRSSNFLVVRSSALFGHGG